MKCQALLLCILMLLTNFENKANGQTYFQRTYAGYSGVRCESAQVVADKGYLIAGSVRNTGNTSYPLLLKTDSLGSTKWVKSYADTGWSIAHSVVQTKDHGYIFAGKTNSLGTGADEVYIVKTDDTGKEQWSRTYGGYNLDNGHSVKETSDNGYVICSRSASINGAGGYDIYLIKIDSIGNIIWSKTYGTQFSESGIFVSQTPDGGYAIAGAGTSISNQSGKFLLMRTDTAGNVLWSKTYGGMDDEVPLTAAALDDGGFMIAGFSFSFGSAPNDYDAYVVRLDSSGNLLWSKSYGGPEIEEISSICQTTGGGFLFAGTTNQPSSPVSDVLLIRTDGGGDLQWAKTLGRVGIDEGVFVKELHNGDLLITGNSLPSLQSPWEIYLIKTDSAGNSGCHTNNLTLSVSTPPTFQDTLVLAVSSLDSSVAHSRVAVSITTNDSLLCLTTTVFETKRPLLNVQVYPNPSNGIFMIQTSAQSSIFEIFDVHGRTILQKLLTSGPNSIDLTSEKAGCYFYKVSLQGSVERGKLLVL